MSSPRECKYNKM